LYSPTADRTYVGYTKDIRHRMRQHKGELADKTKRTRWGKPWNLVGYLSGFPDASTALQFEFAWHHCKKIGKNKVNKLRSTKENYGYPGPWCIQGRICALEILLDSERATKKAPLTANLSLRMYWVGKEKVFEKEHKNCQEKKSKWFKQP
jgi:predicted GIY-YIG superfamily endonuclease